MHFPTDPTAPEQFYGVLHDDISGITIDRSPFKRATAEEALADARALMDLSNADAEAFDDCSDGNTTVGRCDESYCYAASTRYGLLYDGPMLTAPAATEG